MILEMDITWPTTIPIPYIDFSGQPRNSVVLSPSGAPLMERRSRFFRSYSILSVSWVLTSEELELFKNFYNSDLGNGTAAFKIELRFPKKSALTEWSARFPGGFEAQRQDGMWQVKSQLDLVNPINF